MKPIIGIIEWPYKDQDTDEIYEIRKDIIDWIVRSGGRPIGIFPTQIQDFINTRLRYLNDMSDLERQDLDESLNMCDAIIKPGALKIYNYERYIYKYTLEKDMPYLGICAGMQVMANHGKENIRNIRNHSCINHHTSGGYYSHLVNLVEDSKLKEIINKNEILVNSLHNYHISDSGIHEVSAYSPDGYIEAIENPNTSFHLGLQWHPELLSEKDENSQIIFGEFVEAAKTYQKKKI